MQTPEDMGFLDRVTPINTQVESIWQQIWLEKALFWPFFRKQLEATYQHRDQQKGKLAKERREN